MEPPKERPLAVITGENIDAAQCKVFSVARQLDDLVASAVVVARVGLQVNILNSYPELKIVMKFWISPVAAY